MKIKRLLYLLLLSIILFLTGCSVDDVINNIIPPSTTTTKLVITTTKKDDYTFNPSITEVNDVTRTITGSDNKISKVKVASINDTHGQLITDGYLMGISEVEGAIKYLEDADNQKYIRIMNGDLFQGSYVSRKTYGYCLIDALNAANYDCMVLGNHEFDWGLEKIEPYWDGDLSNGEAEFPLLCANLLDKRTGTRPEWIEPYVIIDYYGIKVGIIGTIGGNLETTIAASLVENYEFTYEVPIIKKYAQELHTKGCDVIISATHAYDTQVLESISLSIDSSCPVDAFITAHTHEFIEEYYIRDYDSYRIPNIQSHTKSRTFATLSINLNDLNKPLNATFNHYYQSADCVQKSSPDREVEAVINKYQSIISEGEGVLGTINRRINSKQAVANLMIDAMKHYTNADIGMVNSGGTRVSSLPYGDVMFDDLYEAFPFDNYVVYFYMTGKKIKEYVNSSSGMLFDTNLDLTKFNDNQTYIFVTSDYCANKGDRYILRYTTDNEWHQTEYLMYDMLADYVRDNSPIV